MVNEDTRQFMTNISDLIRHDKSTIVRKNVFGKVGTELYKPEDWRQKCKRLFDKEYKYLNTISNMENNVDPIIDTLSKLSSDKGRVFVFKNYDIEKHLEFFGYEKALLHKKLGSLYLDDISTYLAFVEERKKIFYCHKIKTGNDMDQHMRNITTSIAYFLTLYSKEFISAGVRIIGLLIQESEKERKPLRCKFCDLFSPSYEVFESPTSFDNWWKTIETYNNWWDFSKHAERSECCNLFEDLAASIVGFFNQGLVCETRLDNKDDVFPRNRGTSSSQQQQLNEEHKNNLRRQNVLNSTIQTCSGSINDNEPFSMEDR